MASCTVLMSLVNAFLLLFNFKAYVTANSQDEEAGCPSGFMNLDSSCYYFSESVLNQYNAKIACESVGSTLVSISSAAEEATILNQLTPVGGNIDIWIGITQKNALEFEWDDGSPLEFTFWGDEFDPHDEGTDCVRMDSRFSFHWHDKSCASWSKFNFICEGPGPCPQNALSPYEFGSSCYQAYNGASNPQSYSSAQSYCESNNLYLVTINDEEEHNFIAGLMTEKGYVGIWLGMSQKYRGEYLWMTGEPYNYTNYASSPFEEQTACFKLDAGDGFKWTDSLCDARRPFICETKAQPEAAVKIEQYRLIRKDSVPVISNIVINETAPLLIRCGSKCISHQNCSSFAYNENTMRCILAGPLIQVEDAIDFQYYLLQERTPEDFSKYIWVGDEQGGKVWKADVYKMDFSSVPVSVTLPKKAAYDPVKEYVYVAQESNLLSRGRIDGSSQQVLNTTADSLQIISDMSLDVRSRKLFVLMRNPGVILQYDLDNWEPSPTSFLNTGLNNPLALHVVSSMGHVYFSSANQIERIDIDGSDRTTIYSGSTLAQYSAVTVDVNAEKIFFKEISEKNIVSMSLDGTILDVNFLPEDAEVEGLASHGGLLYWADGDSNLRVTPTTTSSVMSVVTQEGLGVFADASGITIG